MFLLLCSVTEPPNNVSAIEYNIIYRENGEHYHQWIFWDGVKVVEWKHHSYIKNVSYYNGLYHVTWREGNLRYKVQSPIYIKTFTLDDREMNDRKNGTPRGLYAEQLFGSE